MNYHMSLNRYSFVLVRYNYEKTIDKIGLIKNEFVNASNYKRSRTIAMKNVKVPSSFQDIADPGMREYVLEVHKIKMGLRPLGEY